MIGGRTVCGPLSYYLALTERAYLSLSLLLQSRQSICQLSGSVLQWNSGR